MSNTLIDDEFAIPTAAPAAAAEPAVAAEPVVDAPSPFRREIDLGDGSGKQVFEGASAEELIDKLTEAQKHATAKIREQNRALKLAPKPVQEKKTQKAKFEPKTLSADDEFMLAQQWSESPVKTFDKIVEARFGRPIEEVAARLNLVDEYEQERREHSTAVKFVETHPDYVPTAKNFETIKTYLDNNDLAFTKSNLDHAFEELSSGGLLEKPQPTVAATSAPLPQETRIEPVVVAAPKKPASTGLSDRSSRTSPAAGAPQGALTDVEIANMSASEYAAYCQTQWAAQGIR